jgi:hypothetical protein
LHVVGQSQLSDEVRIQPRDTPESLEERVLHEEHKLYPTALESYCTALRQGLLDVAPLPVGRASLISPPEPADSPPKRR